MKFSKVGLLATGVFLSASVVCGVGVSKVTTPIPEGTWCNEDGTYFVVFKSDGTYIESTYNIPRTYEVLDDTLTLYNIAGEASKTKLVKNFGGKIATVINGEPRVLVPSDTTPMLHNHSVEPSGSTTDVYIMKDDFGDKVKLSLKDDYSYTYSIENTFISGMYCKSNSGKLVLLDSEGNREEQFTPCSEGYLSGAMNTDITILSDGTVMGVAESKFSDMKIVFGGKGVALIHYGAEEPLTYNYSLNDSGLVTLTESTGVGGTTYMYFDSFTKTLYRYVFFSDDWFSFLSGGGTQ